LGGKAHDRPGYDLTGVFVGGEGTLGLVTAAIVRLLHVPEGGKTLLASFSALDDASETVSAIIAAGIIPSALEIIDEFFVRAIEEGIGAGYPKGAGAVLLIELDGPREEIEAQAARIVPICRDHAALEVRVAQDEAERALLWKGRKEAAGVVGAAVAGGPRGPRARGSPPSGERCRPAAPATAFGSRTCSMPATATSTR